MKLLSSILRLLDRELLVWGVVPCASATLVVSLFAVPNYLRAHDMRNDAQRLKAVTHETIVAQNNLRKLQSVVASLREERDRRCRPLSDGHERDRLLSAITRPTDGVVIREQSIRTGAIEPVPGMPADFPVQRREVIVQMAGTFDAIFGVLDAAEGIDQLVSPKSVEITILADPIELANTGNAVVRAEIVFDEWFQPGAVKGGAQ